MENDRLARGKKVLDKVDGSVGQQVIATLSDIAPDVGKYIFEFAFGDIYSRKGLSLKQREMITITSLLTQGAAEEQLKVHLRGALNVGLTQAEIIEVFIHCLPYVGFPRVLNAISVAKKIFDNM